MVLSLLALCLSAHADSLNAALTFAGPAESGQGRVQVEITSQEVASSLGSAPDPDRFRAIVGQGDARIDRVRHVATNGETVHTVMAFDRSGSFARYWDQSFKLARAMARALPSDGSHTVSVMTFHSNQTVHGTASSSAQLRDLLAEVEAVGTLGSSSETSLMSAVKDAAQLAAEQQPTTGGRQVILFTDAGEEGAIFTLDEVISSVRAQGTSVHPVVLKQVAAPGSKKARVFSKANDRMKKLAEASGGQHVHVQDVAAALAMMRQYATVGQRLYWLELSYCSVPQGSIRFEDTVQIEVLQGSAIPAKTSAAPFRQHAAGSALLDCDDQPPPSAASTPPATPTAPTEPSGGGGSWLWPLLAGLLLLMMLLGSMLGLVLLIGRRRSNPSAEKPPTPPSPEPLPSASARPVVSPIIQNPGDATAEQLLDDPLALPTPAGDPLQKPMVETRLRIISGPSGLEPYYRISSPSFVIGATPSSDLYLDINQISSRHATIQVYKLGAVFITDHSLNGTFLDGKRLKKGERVQVRPGQRIGISQQLTVELWQPDSDPVSAPPPAPETPAEKPTPKARQKTVYNPMSTAPPPVSTTSDRARRAKSKTIIQPLRRDDET